MKKPFSLAAAMLLLCGAAFGASNKTSDEPVTASFSTYSYSGNDARYTTDGNFNRTENYLNPILSGTYPDPSICRKGNDYYLVNSSFCFFPGIPIWHSTDLVNWKQLGYVLDRPSQLMMKTGLDYGAGIYAPDIKYNPHNDTFYLIVTGVGFTGNFIVKTQDPAKGWSDPIDVPEVRGIDPSFLFDTDGKTYILNNDAPEGEAEYDGHRAIWIREYDTTTDKVCGQATVLVDKGIRPEEKPIWIEGPHLYHIGDKYYLTSAEGGTGPWHSQVVLVGDKPTGPFKVCDINPILTQRDLPNNREFPITCAGHADFVQTPEGDWWTVFLAVLPYNHHDNTGRNTFLLPVKWENGQPIILDQGKVIPTVGTKKNNGTATELTGNFSLTDNFDGDEMDMRWIKLRTPVRQWWKQENGKMNITAKDVSLDELRQPSFLCRWVKHTNYEASTVLEFTPTAKEQLAGFSVFQRENAHYIIGKRLKSKGKYEVVLIRTDKEETKLIASTSLDKKVADLPLGLKIEGSGKEYKFFYSTGSDNWIQLGDAQNGDIITTGYSGGFTGSLLGLYATTNQTYTE